MLSETELDEARQVIARALDEDLRYGPDVTTAATVPAGVTAEAAMVTRAPGVIAGVDLALLVLDEVLGSDGYQVLDKVADGARLPAGAPVLRLKADTRGLLTAERTMLNLVCHLSGIATATAAWVDAVNGIAGASARIRDTRKTLPGLRVLQKYAVRVGGGVNHRMGLGDAALIKDNHVAAAGSVAAALRAVRAAAPDVPCEVEVDSLEQFDEVLAEGPGAGAVGQLRGLADPDGGAAARLPRTRCTAGVIGRTHPGLRRRLRRHRSRLPGRGRPYPFGAGARHRLRHVGHVAPVSADIGDEHRHFAVLHPQQEWQRAVTRAGRQDPRVDHMQLSAGQLDIGLAGGHHVLDPVGLAVTERDRQHVALAVGGHHRLVRLAGLTPRWVITDVPGMNLDSGLTTGFTYLICRRSTQAGNTAGSVDGSAAPLSEAMATPFFMGRGGNVGDRYSSTSHCAPP